MDAAIAKKKQMKDAIHGGVSRGGGRVGGGTGMAPTPTPSKNVKQCRMIIV